MGERISIRSGKVVAEAELNDSDCARAIAEALPIEAVAGTWGEEVYFDIGVSCDCDDSARQDMAIGELGYWPTGSALCIFFGTTPASTEDEPRAASNVNPIGRISSGAESLKKLGPSIEVRVESMPQAQS